MTYRKVLRKMVAGTILSLVLVIGWFLLPTGKLPNSCALRAYVPARETAVPAQSCVPDLTAVPASEIEHLLPVLNTSEDHLANQIARTTSCGLESERHLSRLLDESRVSAQVWFLFSKQERETIYLNHAYFGDGQYGIWLAAEHYFAVTPQALTMADSALLMCLERGGSIYSPYRHPDRALECRNRLLDKVKTRGALSESDAEAAKRAALGVVERP